MLATYSNTSLPSPTYIFTPAGGYPGQPSQLLHSYWYYVHGDYFDYAVPVYQVLPVRCQEPIEQENVLPQPSQPSRESSPTSRSIKPPLKVPQNLATQVSRDESPDNFILSAADQKTFRRLFPLRKPLLPERNPEDQRPTLVLDLDETLIHTTFEAPSEPEEYENVNITLLGSTKTVYVNMRPWVRTFLRAVSHWFEVVIYTASISTYANSILDTLDPKGEIFSYRLYREHCSFFKGVYVKDLEALGRPLETTVFVDNFPGAYMMQPSNAVPVTSFIGASNDNELVKLMKLLKILRFKDDVRPVLRRYQTQWKSIHFNSEQSKTLTES